MEKFTKDRKLAWIKDLLDYPEKLSFFKSRASSYHIPVKDLIELWDEQNGICELCGDCLDFNKTTHIDHIIPVSKDGKNKIENLQFVCAKCNYAKRDMSTRDFLIMCIKVNSKSQYLVPKIEQLKILNERYKYEGTLKRIEKRKEWNRQYKEELKKNI